MKVSYLWLQDYFDKKLPDPEKIRETITMHAFEVESLEKIGEDTLLDIKILPDRAHDCLSHRGIARVLSAILDLPLHKEKTPSLVDYKESNVLTLDVQDSRCNRNLLAAVQNVEVQDSPSWLKERLELIGQRSINNIVDATNYIMFATGQPLHAFDFDKLTKKDGKAHIILRKAHDGEKIVLLGGKELTLNSDILVFADGNKKEHNALDIAGIKGGTLAQVDKNTTNIILFAANFDQAYIRKNARKLGVLTDASKRSENGFTTELADRALSDCVDLINQIAGTAVSVEGIIDYYKNKPTQHSINITVQDISSRLGIEMSETELEDILLRLHFEYTKQEKTYIVKIPFERLDLRSKENIIEDVGQIYGYEKIPSIMPRFEAEVVVNKEVYYSNKIRALLVELGFSEVFTYAFQNTGDVELENPLASDKGFLRSNLQKPLMKSLELNAKNAVLLGLEEIKICEIGTVFTKESEHLSLAVGVCIVKNSKNKEKNIVSILDDVFARLSVELSHELDPHKEYTELGGVYEINLSNIFEKLPTQHGYDWFTPASDSVKYKPISLYPFASRDVAVFVPEETLQESLEKIIIEKSGALLVRKDLFDIFTKTFSDNAKKTSYAFRLVFQSHEKTLTEDEINGIMTAITDEMNSKEGWQVR